jgi:hypothetical protein
MVPFKAVFTIIEVANCPFYKEKDWILLTGKAVQLPPTRPSCLILVRELTILLFHLLSQNESEFAEQQDYIHSCGGCSGLVKFKFATATDHLPEGDGEEEETVMSGNLTAIPPAELLQVFHMHQKTGRLMFDLADGSGRVTFRDGAIVGARYNDLDNQEAIYSLLRKKKGCFRFLPGLPQALRNAREIGDFMMILMQGLKMLDEDDSAVQDEGHTTDSRS